MQTRTRAFLVFSFAAVAMTGCKKAPDFGLAVALTIDSNAISPSTRSEFRRFSIVASGAEVYEGTLPLPNGAKAIETTVYQPSVSTGDLTLAITALDGNNLATAYGTVIVVLKAGKTVEAKIVLGTNVPEFPDLAGSINDMSGVTDGMFSADLTGVPGDMSTPPDLLIPPPTTFPPAAAWISSGGSAASGPNSRVGISIGGTSPAGRSVAPSGATVNFGLFSSSNK